MTALTPARVLLVGAGALGSHLAYMLRSEDIAWTLVDFDHVEAKNVLAQFHPRASTRANKASALRSTLWAWNPALSITARPVEFTAQHNGHALVAEQQLVVDACDNPKARQDLRAVCIALRVPLLHLGIDGTGQTGIVAWDERYTIDPAPPSQVATCEGGEHLPMICRVAAEGALCVQRWLHFGERVSTLVPRESGVRL